MAKDLKSQPETPSATSLADEALEQMFGYYSRETQFGLRATNDGASRVISELDAAGAILAARRAA